MKKITFGNTEIEYYDSIEELPIRRYHKYNKMLLVDAGIGNDLFDADGRIERAMRFITSGDAESAKRELVNLRNTFFLMQNEISPRFRAFAALVTSVNGTKYDDVSDDGISQIIEALQDVSVEFVTATLEAVKKKISAELKAYFPKMKDDANTKEYYDLLKRRILSVLDGAINSSDNSKEIEELNTRLITFSKPYDFSGEDNAEIACDKNFEVMCHVITENTGTNAKNLSVLEFYTAYEYTQDKIKAREKAYKAK